MSTNVDRESAEPIANVHKLIVWHILPAGRSQLCFAVTDCNSQFLTHYVVTTCCLCSGLAGAVSVRPAVLLLLLLLAETQVAWAPLVTAHYC